MPSAFYDPKTHSPNFLGLSCCALHCILEGDNALTRAIHHPDYLDYL